MSDFDEARELDRRSHKLIDEKLPLTWLIGSAAAIVIAFATVVVKLDNVTSSLTKLELKTDQRDDRITLLIQNIAEVKGKNDTQQTQIDRNYQDLTEVKRNIEDLRRNQKWLTK